MPNVLQLTSLSPLIIEPVKAPNITDPVDARIDPSAIPTNLAVPGVFVADILNKRPTPTITSAVDFLTDVVLGVPAGQPQSQVERVLSMKPHPTTIFFWAGNNDVLFPVLTGDFSLLTSPASFFASLEAIMQKLSGANHTLVVANIPDVTTVPYLTSAETIAAQAHVPVEYVRFVLGLAPGDTIRPAAQRLVPGILQHPGTGPLPQMHRARWQESGPSGTAIYPSPVRVPEGRGRNDSRLRGDIQRDDPERGGLTEFDVSRCPCSGGEPEERVRGWRAVSDL